MSMLPRSPHCTLARRDHKSACPCCCQARGRLSGIGDRVHSEICPNNWFYHSLQPNSTSAGSGGHRRLTAGTEALDFPQRWQLEAAMPLDNTNDRHLEDVDTAQSGYLSSMADSLQRAFGHVYSNDEGALDLRQGRQLAAAASTSNGTHLEGKHVELVITKHSGDLTFMAVTADHAPHRLQPPYRIMREDTITDSAIFCNLHSPNIYWLAINGGDHCAVYDIKVSCAKPDRRLRWTVAC